ncbi:ParB/RepB/Spo0J family partition protein [Sulfitobacter geojensis]|uniref:ParB N-terminal domain-containing protein n=1 Tax=Sulfitobacter geojensis TaxID=1342299 RepID=A0AAE3B8M6_9RHOB|nr:ParB/Srx family N-terminal domain-containing protein [Sulfitobacter geojensis]MBM1691437.1 ParB N-terminal domain-containing protein [Sulfitobacter geojensis]MBM1695503.1 ParB N-terminal domain-containing protein [Sulfitobacter geojensis]MBM1707691.1 ParB N-terminal domain-containing protein [Sulfitobacter geojensis]MBM1711753.1 ParB N-terminal domain-containing protein [Sulfitobacter geojensis]MBM1715816.1 ParB N-terminal domain-containing protein [Sulfitobacter geojensis]
MTTQMTSQQIEIGKLEQHPANVRAQSVEAYEPENIVHLKASIVTLGLIQPLVVQKIGSKYGVLGGGRRRAALQELAADTSEKAFTSKTKVECRVVPADCDLTTAISLAENITQAPMSPIDQFEAFARMMKTDNQSIASIAMTFGTTEIAVKERLRYGLVHSSIREAVRAKTLTLDAMKAFADHPSPEVQFEVFEALTQDGARPHAHQIKSTLRARGIQVGDALGAFIRDDYEAKGGGVAADLLDEHSVLEDMDLAKKVLIEKLQAAAEAERDRLGFAWADAAGEHDYQMFSSYGRVYPATIVPDAAGQARLEEIATLVSALEDRQSAEEISQDEADEIYDEIDTLTEEADELQTGYLPDDLKNAGVFATWNHSNVHLTVGLIRPEDQVCANATSGGDGNTAPEDVTKSDVITYSAALSSDLQMERAMALGAALASHPEIATDFALFKIINDVLCAGARTYAIDLTVAVQHRTHAKLDEIDRTAQEQMDVIRETLDLGWADETRSPAEQFAKFRALDGSKKAALAAFVVGLTVKPCFARNRTADVLMYDLEAEIMPDLRAHWAPNAALFGRFKKAQLLHMLNADLGLTQEALNLAGSSKNDVVTFCDQLFAEPFATLTDAQRTAVATWCPPDMQTVTPAATVETSDVPDHIEDHAKAA